MEDKSDRRKLAVSGVVTKAFGILMVVLYIVIGTTIIFKAPVMMPRVKESYAIIFGVALVLYGLYRGYKYYQKYF